MTGIKKWNGFSLVEIVVALAIVSVALVSIMSLISLSLQSSKDSRDDTNISVMTQTMVSQLRTMGYTNALSVIGTGSSSLSYYFDSSGAPVHDNSGVLISGTNGSGFTAVTSTAPIYICTITNKTPAPLPAGFPSKFAWWRLDFEWPYTAPAANRQHKYVYTSLAQYN